MSISSVLFLYTSALVMSQGGVGMGIVQAPDALLYNPAIVSRNLSASFTYCFPYSISELGYFNFGFAYRGFSVAGARFALDDLFSDQALLFGYRRKFIRRLDIGLGIGYRFARVRDYNDAKSALVTGGIRYKFGPLYFGGSFLSNLKSDVSFTGSNKERFSDRYNFGCSFSFPKGVNWTLEGKPGSYLRAGVDVSFTRGLSVRMGVFDKSRFTVGFGLLAEFIAFDFALLEHRELGNTYIYTIRFVR